MADLIIENLSDIESYDALTMSERIKRIRLLARKLRDSIEPGSSRENSMRRMWAGTIEGFAFDIESYIKKLEEPASKNDLTFGEPFVVEKEK